MFKLPLLKVLDALLCVLPEDRHKEGEKVYMGMTQDGARSTHHTSLNLAMLTLKDQGTLTLQYFYISY